MVGSQLRPARNLSAQPAPPATPTTLHTRSASAHLAHDVLAQVDDQDVQHILTREYGARVALAEELRPLRDEADGNRHRLLRVRQQQRVDRVGEEVVVLHPQVVRERRLERREQQPHDDLELRSAWTKRVAARLQAVGQRRARISRARRAEPRELQFASGARCAPSAGFPGTVGC